MFSIVFFAMGNTEGKTQEVARARCLGFCWTEISENSLEQWSLISPRLVGLYDMDVSLNGGTPQIIHFNRVFHYFHHPFWEFSPYFWFNTHIQELTHPPAVPGKRV